MRMTIIYYAHRNKRTQNKATRKSIKNIKSIINREEKKYEEVCLPGLRLCA